MEAIKKEAIKNVLLTTVYIFIVVSFMNYASTIRIGKANDYLGPAVLLLLFVFSASLTGFLIFGKPAQLYLDGKKKEALTLLRYTLLALGIVTITGITILLILVR